MSGAPIIYMKNINKGYGDGDARVEVLRDIDLRVESGEFVAILGPSGSGKSTLMNLIGMIDTCDSGAYFLGGEDVRLKSEDDYADIRNRRIGFVFQKFNLINKYSALQNVALPLLLRGMKHREAVARAQHMLRSVQLGDRMRHRPHQLSGGQQQRVAIARALIARPDIILADEPTGALDSKTGVEILELMRELNCHGKTIILITHDLNVAGYARRVLSVHDGRIVS